MPKIKSGKSISDWIFLIDGWSMKKLAVSMYESAFQLDMAKFAQLLLVYENPLCIISRNKCVSKNAEKF